jgi:hypothetical protein
MMSCSASCIFGAFHRFRSYFQFFSCFSDWVPTL